MIRTVILAAGILLAAQCTTTNPPPLPSPTPAPIPTVVVVEPADASPDAELDASHRSPCALACAHLAALKCLEALPTPAGATCTEVCSNAESGPPGTSLDAACVIKATTCKKAEACP